VSDTTPRIVIVGGGAGGLELASRLGRRLGKRRRAEIVLIDAALVHVWKPLYHEVAAGTLDSHEDAVTYLVQAHRAHFKFQVGRMCGLDRASKQVSLEAVKDAGGNEIVPPRRVGYDLLVIAVGSVANHFGIPGAEEHCLHLDALPEAEQFHQRVLQILLRAQANPGSVGRSSVAIIGAGATGVELAAELRGAAERAVHYGFEHIDPTRDLRITLIEGAPRILPPLPAELAAKTARQLQAMNVELILGERVALIDAAGVHTESGREIPAQLKVWTAGIKAPEVLREIGGLETDRGDRLVLRQTLQTTRDPDIFALGDCAACPQPGTEAPVPPRAQAASQQARFLATALELRLQGRTLPVFVYRDRGSLISLNTGQQAVGRLMGAAIRGLMIEGTVARLAYAALYKKHLIALHGTFKTVVMTIGNWLTRPVKSRLKLH
jgi:NADH:ubiquinone reductase (H+-translocating)